MILQAQILTPRGRVLAYENREVGTAREAEDLRRAMERRSDPDRVRVVALCSRFAIRESSEVAV